MNKPILAAMLSCQTTSLTDDEKRLFSKYNPLGINLFTRNIESFEQLKNLIEEIKNTINREDVLIAVDEEGGRVARLSEIAPKRVSAEILGTAPLKYSRMHAEVIADVMHKLGINVNYAPVVEKITKPQSQVLASRCFSANTRAVVNRTKIMSETYINEGICPCIKHLPGHFYATEDPHLQMLKTDLSKKTLEKELAYLRFCASYPLAMTAHIYLTAIDNENPVSMSKKCVSGFIRKELGFDNFLISDAIDMRALKGNITEKTCACLDSGLDAVCYCAGRKEELTEICEQKRFLTEKSLIRFANIKKVIHNIPNNKNISDIEKQYQTKFQDKLDMKYAYDATEVLNKMLKERS